MSEPYRILAADDEDEFLNLYRQIISHPGDFNKTADGKPLASGTDHPPKRIFDLSLCSQADDAVYLVRESLKENRPYSVVFLDVRMPPGPDGIWAAQEIRKMDPHVEIVIITAFADVEPADIISLVPPAHKLIYIQKPFFLKEIYHFAYSLSAKWSQEKNIEKLTAQLEKKVTSGEQELAKKNRKLTAEIMVRRQAEKALRAGNTQLREILDASIDWIVHLTEDKRIIWTNQTITNHLGKNTDALIGKTCHESIMQNADLCKKCPFQRTKETGKIERDVIYYPNARDTKAGSYRDIYCVPLNNGHAVDKTYLVVSRDITQRMKAEASLKEANAKLSEKSLQRKRIARKLIQILENERRHTAMELHDHMGNAITTIRIGFKDLHEKLSSNVPELLSLSQTIEKNAIEKITGIKNIAYDLMPHTLENLGLLAAAKALVTEMKNIFEMKVIFYSNNIPDTIDPEKSLGLYRILQEALTNVTKHAMAKKVHINLVKKEKAIVLSIEDDGIGFEKDRFPGEHSARGMLGLLIMQERAVQLGGHVVIDSQPNGGTYLEAQIPY
ncbi:MAG: response regulator [Deltaproteobacteria bacterium]|nr:response regulator [Deltaproteobacteria bacterium]